MNAEGPKQTKQQLLTGTQTLAAAIPLGLSAEGAGINAHCILSIYQYANV